MESNLYKQMNDLLAKAQDEYFEDGMESQFSRELVSLIKKYGNAAIEVLAHVIVYEKCDVKVAAEALRWLGHIEHASSYRFRLWLLEKSLSYSSVLVRDGAVLGLSVLDDPAAIPSLEQALDREPSAALRADMQQVLAQLQHTKRVVAQPEEMK
jgi:hypothetical protein